MFLFSEPCACLTSILPQAAALIFQNTLLPGYDVNVQTHVAQCVEVRGQLFGVSALLPSWDQTQVARFAWIASTFSQ